MQRNGNYEYPSGAALSLFFRTFEWRGGGASKRPMPVCDCQLSIIADDASPILSPSESRTMPDLKSFTPMSSPVSPPEISTEPIAEPAQHLLVSRGKPHRQPISTWSQHELLQSDGAILEGKRAASRTCIASPLSRLQDDIIKMQLQRNQQQPSAPSSYHDDTEDDDSVAQGLKREVSSIASPTKFSRWNSGPGLLIAFPLPPAVFAPVEKSPPDSRIFPKPPKRVESAVKVQPTTNDDKSFIPPPATCSGSKLPHFPRSFDDDWASKATDSTRSNTTASTCGLSLDDSFTSQDDNGDFHRFPKLQRRRVILSWPSLHNDE